MRLVVLLVSLALAAASPQQGILGRKVGSGQANSLGTGGPPCGSRQCDPGYIKFGELCYKLAYADSPLNYNQAIAACRREKALLASPKTTKEYENLRVLGEGITEAQDIQTRRAFIGMFCGVDCVEPSRWRYADGERCTSNMFCDWSVSNTINEWNSIPSLAGASVAALLDGKEQFPYKIQAFPGDHRLQYFICQKSGTPDGETYDMTACLIWPPLEAAPSPDRRRRPPTVSSSLSAAHMQEEEADMTRPEQLPPRPIFPEWELLL